MTFLVNNFAAGSSGLGALGFDWSAFVIQLITFVLAYLLLRRYAFGPILKILRERKEVIDKGVKLGEEMQREKAELEAKLESELANARSKADNIISSAHESAKEAIKDAEISAQQKAEIILKEAEERTRQELSRAKRELEGELSELVVEATEVLTREKVNDPKDRALINQTLKEQAQS